jgi:hypothetical protein
MQVLD